MSSIVVTISLKSELSAALEGTHENAQALKKSFEGKKYVRVEKTFGRGRFMNLLLPKGRLAEFTEAVSEHCVISEKREVNFPKDGDAAAKWDYFLSVKGLSYNR